MELFAIAKSVSASESVAPTHGDEKQWRPCNRIGVATQRARATQHKQQLHIHAIHVLSASVRRDLEQSWQLRVTVSKRTLRTVPHDTSWPIAMRHRPQRGRRREKKELSSKLSLKYVASLQSFRGFINCYRNTCSIFHSTVQLH